MRVLVADDDQGLRISVKNTLLNTGRFEVDEAFDGVNALEKCEEKSYSLVFLDMDMPRMGGLETLKKLKEQNPATTVIIMTAYATIDDAVRAVKEGAFNYLSKPVNSNELLENVDKALAAYNIISSVAHSAPVLMEEGRKIVGNTKQMQKVFNIIGRLSKVSTPVLIRGASGTGKELIARAIHMNSARKNEKFIGINCSTIHENLFESELFGHEKGSFTGADQRKIGKFQFAEGGTLFLDEIGDMPAQTQVKLLRVLQEKLFTPVGANLEIEANVRVIAATNRPLEKMIKEGSYREDLFYRLNVMPIFLPSLKERVNDIDTMVNHFIQKFNQSHDKAITGMGPDALACLKKYDWPGNIRELENVIEHAFIMETTNTLSVLSLPENLLASTGVDVEALSTSYNEVKNGGTPSDSKGEDTSTSSADPSVQNENSTIIEISSDNLDFNMQKERFEREFIIKALKTFKGRINQTALHANIPKKTLLRKIEKYGINAKDYVL